MITALRYDRMDIANSLLRCNSNIMGNWSTVMSLGGWGGVWGGPPETNIVILNEVYEWIPGVDIIEVDCGHAGIWATRNVSVGFFSSRFSSFLFSQGDVKKGPHLFKMQTFGKIVYGHGRDNLHCKDIFYDHLYWIYKPLWVNVTWVELCRMGGLASKSLQCSFTTSRFINYVSFRLEILFRSVTKFINSHKWDSVFHECSSTASDSRE